MEKSRIVKHFSCKQLHHTCVDRGLEEWESYVDGAKLMF